MSDIIQQARDYVDSRGTTHQPRAYELARALVEMADAEPKQERPNKGDPMLDAVLKVRSAEFDAWVKSLPSVYWARYDLSACRIGWEAGRVAMQQAERDALRKETP